MKDWVQGVGRDQVCRVSTRWTSTPDGLGHSLHYLSGNIVTVSEEYVCVFSERTENEVMYWFVLYLGMGQDGDQSSKNWTRLYFYFILY